jgi:hypothetical protein
MTRREVRKARGIRADLGLAERRRNDASLVDRLEGDIERLDQAQRGVAEEFRATEANWNSDDTNGAILPRALTEDSAVARKYRIAATLALLAEMCVAAWMFSARDMNPWVGALFALCVTVILECCIHFAICALAAKRPKVALRTLRNFAFFPAFGLFIFGVGTTLIARSVEGALAADERLLGVVSVGLFILTLALVVLSAALSTAAFVYGWSARLARRYNALDAEARVSRALVAEIRRESPAITHSAATESCQDGSDLATYARSAVMSIPRTASPAASILVLFLPLAGVGCTDQPAMAEERTGAVANYQAGPVCNAVVDTSGSLSNLNTVWTHVRRELPDFVISRKCAALRVFTFDVDGWTWKPVVELAIPAPRYPVAAQIPSELQGVKTIKDAAEMKQRALSAAADAAHRQVVDGLLRQLDTVDEHLRQVSSTCCSDPVGVLRRISRTPNAQDVFVIVTDMADTGKSSRHPVLAVQSPGVRVLVLLVPAKAHDAVNAGAPTDAADQYDDRARLVRIIAPWASVAPYFASEYADLLDWTPSQTGADQ